MRSHPECKVKAVDNLWNVGGTVTVYFRPCFKPYFGPLSGGLLRAVSRLLLALYIVAYNPHIGLQKTT